MAQRKSDNGGCAPVAIVAIAIGIWLLLWAVKIVLIVVGALLVPVGAVGAVAAVVALIASRVGARGTRRAAARFDEEIAALSDLSRDLLRQELAEWDRIQLDRGVGTRLEQPYFTGTMPADLQRILDRVNALMSTGEAALARADGTGSRTDRVAALDSIDRTWLELESLRARITR